MCYPEHIGGREKGILQFPFRIFLSEIEVICIIWTIEEHWRSTACRQSYNNKGTHNGLAEVLGPKVRLNASVSSTDYRCTVFHRTLFFFFLLLGFLLKLGYDILIYLHKFPLKSQVAFICLSRPREGNEFPRAEAHLDANLCACRCAFRVRVCCHSFSGATWSISNDYGFMVSTCGTASNSWSEFIFFQSLSETSKLLHRKIMHFTLKHGFLFFVCLR